MRRVASAPSSPTSSATRSRATSPTTLLTESASAASCTARVAEWHERSLQRGRAGPALRAARPSLGARRRSRQGRHLPRARAGGRRCAAARSARRCIFLDAPPEVEGADAGPDRATRCGRRASGTAQYFLGDFDRSRECLERAPSRSSRRPFPIDAPRRRARRWRGAVAAQAAHLVRPARYPRAPPRRRRTLIAEALGCYKIIGQIGYLEGEPTPDAASTARSPASTSGEEAGPSPDLARMLSTRPRRAASSACRRLADRYAARAIAMVDAGAQREASAYVWNVRAVIDAHRGELGRARGGQRRRRSSAWGRSATSTSRPRSGRRARRSTSARAPSAPPSPRGRRHRELAERKGNPQNLCWSLARRGRDAASAATRSPTPRPGARRRARHPDRGQRRQQHDREALRDRGRPRGAGPPRRGGRGRRRDHRDARPPAAGGLPLRRLLRRRGAGLLRRLEDGARPGGGRCARRSAVQARAPRLAPVRQRARRAAGCCRAGSSGSEGGHDRAREPLAHGRGGRVSDGHAVRASPARSYEIVRHGAGANREAVLADAAATLERSGALELLGGCATQRRASREET